MMHGKRVFFACLVTVLATGCTDQMHEDLQEWIQQQKSMARPRVQPIKAPTVFIPQAYEMADATEPFNRSKLTQVLAQDTDREHANVALLTQEQNRRKEELESYPLDSITMVGSMQKGRQHIALLKVNQLIYQAAVGNYLGQNYGRIVHIDEHRIRLREVVQDASGDWVERMATLDLQEGGK